MDHIPQLAQFSPALPKTIKTLQLKPRCHVMEPALTESEIRQWCNKLGDPDSPKLFPYYQETFSPELSPKPQLLSESMMKCEPKPETKAEADRNNNILEWAENIKSPESVCAIPHPPTVKNPESMPAPSMAQEIERLALVLNQLKAENTPFTPRKKVMAGVSMMSPERNNDMGVEVKVEYKHKKRSDSAGSGLTDTSHGHQKQKVETTRDDVKIEIEIEEVEEVTKKLYYWGPEVGEVEHDEDSGGVYLDGRGLA